jgi:hypothetical protein
MTAGKTPGRRETSLEVPGYWYVCSGDDAQPLADIPGTYRVTSSNASTISVEVYDSGSKAPPQNLDPNKYVDILVNSVLFLAPVQTYSGTAQGTYAKIP